MLPVFAVVYAVAAPGSIRRRIAGLAVAAVSVIVAVRLVGRRAWSSSRPRRAPTSAAAPTTPRWTSSSATTASAASSARAGAAAPGGGQGGGGFSGTPGILRLFNSQLGGQIAWFLPLSVIGLAAGLVSRFRAPRTDLARAAFLMWGGWLAVHAIVFSLMSGVIHSYYVVAMAPAVGALVGGGVVAMWRARERHPWVGARARASRSWAPRASR